MRLPVGLLLLGTMLFLPHDARAEEVVYFTNGTYMHVLSHEVKGDMVRVRLDGDAAVAFPSKLIEKIEGTYGVVFSKPGTLQANQAAPSQPGVANAQSPYPVGVNPALASRASTPPVSQQKPYVPGGAISGEGAKNKYADDTILGSIQPGPTGSHMLGNRLVIDSGKRPGGKSTFTPSPFQAKPGLAKPNNGLPSSPFPGPGNTPVGQESVAGERPMPVEEPVPDEPEPEGGP